jgi:hypothetical protein
VSPAKQPHTITPPQCFMVGTTQRSKVHTEIIHSPTLHLTKTRWLEPRIAHFQRSNIHCSCFLAQESLFFILVSFSSGFFAAIRPWRPDSRNLLCTVDVEMCRLLELCEAFIWTPISEAGNSNELILCSRGNSGSSFPHESQFHYRAWFFLRLHLKFDVHVLKKWWTVVFL